MSHRRTIDSGGTRRRHVVSKQRPVETLRICARLGAAICKHVVAQEQNPLSTPAPRGGDDGRVIYVFKWANVSVTRCGGHAGERI